ncbi:SGNH/GDSL hydrolase family protein [Nocardioides sp. MAH-18]|uniref:SGNH/GDSL hydrolase family protein n=1 Tax=Nocardioides agri TaxID=2682843 RepID=A0A6L6XVU9_9ACTN|nr:MULTISPECIES: SGNH/GDSL hydrolase family protein [unclassified Nocardioides]MBA2954831.1 SGNH/GDSL hydrolase family protein [Nocardioides sp. CGMCC 1.13656]MVQ49685.1 SGNH/GDSL hydrolase family protein [Nocardioides sp. MAH-18]
MLRTSATALLALALTTVAGCADDDPQPAPLPAHGVGEPTSGATPVIQYVALGDSYTAAPLVPPTDTSTICLRSQKNYPAIVTEGLPGARLTDVSCSGATTLNVTTRQEAQTGGVPPQLRAVRPGTELVTIGLGGNDEALFGTMLVRCTQLAKQEPQGTPCSDELQDGVDGTLDRTRDNLVEVVQRVRRRAPDARVLLVGYPQIVPESGTCPDLPLAAGDYPFVRSVNERLAGAVEHAAEDADADYVDVWTPSAGHDICGAEPWINGRVTKLDTALAYHPLAVEQQAVAELVLGIVS